jgi:mRNA interferase MazF
MTTFKQGDVLLVPYPFTDQTGSKQRPAVVISSLTYNQAHPDIILPPITSQIKALADQVALRNSDKITYPFGF